MEIDLTREESSHGPKSVLIRIHGEAAQNLADKWIGTIQWVCKSNLRPKHKRQNWFIGVFELHETPNYDAVDEASIRYEAFRAGGPGGQHQNTTDSAVRATCAKTDVSVVVREGRSQHRNKAIALERLTTLLTVRNSLKEASQKQYRNMLHHRIERGNPVRRFKGLDFREVQK